jgi:hypothetical protein
MTDTKKSQQNTAAGDDHGRGRTALKWLFAVISRSLVVLAAAATTLISAKVLSGQLDPPRALAAALAAMVALVLALAAVLPAWRTEQILGRLRILKLGSFFSLELAPYEREFAATDRAADTQDEQDVTSAKNLIGLKRDFEMRLAYLAKWLLAVDPRYTYASADPLVLDVLKSAPVKQRLVPTYLNVGSMMKDGYLTDDEGRIGYGILGMQEVQFTALPPPQREVFLKGGNAFVNNMRIRVFYQEVRQRISKLGWDVEPVGTTGQRDLVVSASTSPDHQHHIIPVMSENPQSSYVLRLTARLSNGQRIRGNGRRFLIVPPPYNKGRNDDERLLSRASARGEQDRVWTVTLSALTLWLGNAPSG